MGGPGAVWIPEPALNQEVELTIQATQMPRSKAKTKPEVLARSERSEAVPKATVMVRRGEAAGLAMMLRELCAKGAAEVIS